MKKNIFKIATLLLILGSCGTNQSSNESAESKDKAKKEEVNYAKDEINEEVYVTEEAAEEGGAEYEMDEPSIIEHNTESYSYIQENAFKNPINAPLSTFSIDVDNASYTNVRRMLEMGNTPPADAIRIEEFINYFDYDYPNADKHPFSIQTDLAACPWNKENALLKVGLHGKSYEIEDLPASNLVFLIDVSGSMSDANKLPLLKKSFNKMVQRLNKKDKVSIVVYAGSSGSIIEGASCDNIFPIINAINNLEAGGSTSGAEGIELAYQIAEKHLMPDGNNRIFIATDGDFNVGPSSDSEMQRLIESKRDKGIYLTVLGFGMGNYKDSKMEAIADHGNGNYFYIDDMRESNRTLVDNLAGTLLTIAKDVKIQIEFNPENVKSYRLIGYENRLLNDEDFADDKKDAGEIGAGHTVTAIYEIEPGNASKGIKLNYQNVVSSGNHNDLATLKLRYKLPKESKSQLISQTVAWDDKMEEMNKDFMFASSIAAFGMKMRNSNYLNGYTMEEIVSLAKSGLTESDRNREEAIDLMKLFMALENNL